MADTIYTRALARAAEAQGSTQSLASLLRVPESTLLRWMSGRAQMPLQAFLKLIEVLVQFEKTGGDATLDGANVEKRTFKMGELLARCPGCDTTEFVAVEPAATLRFTSQLACVACGERVVHGNLIAQLARDAVHQSRAMTVARAKQRERLPGKSPRLRAMNPVGGDDSGT